MTLAFAVGILTYRAPEKGRKDLLMRTYASVSLTFGLSNAAIVVLENGFTTDRAADWFYHYPDCATFIANKDGQCGPGRGRNNLMRLFSELDVSDDTIVVLSDDDMVWDSELTTQKLLRFWKEAPDDLLLVSGLLEDVWDWNIPRGRIDAGGERALWRDSAPGAAWTFPYDRWKRFGPIEDGFGSDYSTCQRIVSLGGRVAQMDLAKHIGWGKSTHGNESDKNATPLNRRRWGV